MWGRESGEATCVETGERTRDWVESGGNAMAKGAAMMAHNGAPSQRRIHQPNLEA